MLTLFFWQLVTRTSLYLWKLQTRLPQKLSKFNLLCLNFSCKIQSRRLGIFQPRCPCVDISPLVHEELRHSLMKQLIQNGGTHFNLSAFGERPIHREQSLTNWKISDLNSSFVYFKPLLLKRHPRRTPIASSYILRTNREGDTEEDSMNLEEGNEVIIECLMIHL